MISTISQLRGNLNVYCSVEELMAGDTVAGTLVSYDDISGQFIDMPVTIMPQPGLPSQGCLIKIQRNHLHDERMERFLTKIQQPNPLTEFYSRKSFTTYSTMRLFQEEAALLPPCELEACVFPMNVDDLRSFFYDRRAIVEAFKIKSLVCHSIFPRLSYQTNKPFFEVLYLPNFFNKPVFYEKKGEVLKSQYWKRHFLEPSFRLKDFGFLALTMEYCSTEVPSDPAILDRIHFEKQTKEVQCSGIQELSRKGVPHLLHLRKGLYDTGKGEKRMAYFSLTNNLRFSEVIIKDMLTLCQTREIALQLLQAIGMMHEVHEVHGYLNDCSLFLQPVKDGNYVLQLSGVYVYSLIATHPAAGADWSNFQAPPELYRAQKEGRPYSLHPSLDVWHLGDLLFFMRYHFSLLRNFNLTLSNVHYERGLDLFQKHVEVTLSHSVNKIDQLIGGMFSLNPSDRPSMDIVIAEVHLWME